MFDDLNFAAEGQLIHQLQMEIFGIQSKDINNIEEERRRGGEEERRRGGEVREPESQREWSGFKGIFVWIEDDVNKVKYFREKATTQ